MSPRYLHSKRVHAVQAIALANGGHLHQTSDGSHSRLVHWDIAGNCNAPVTVILHGRPEERIVTPDNPSRFVEMEVACRKCENCLRRRAAMWRHKAGAEWRLGVRTWLCTFTLRPDEAFRLTSKARLRLAKGGTDYDLLPVDEQFIEAEGEGYRHVQLLLKRWRKAGAVIRYLCVTEAHKSGLPHWHMLLHELDPERPLRHKDLKGSWPLGWDSYKLVADQRAASYVAKYLGKEVRARVRASSDYGRGNWRPTDPLANPLMRPEGREAEGYKNSPPETRTDTLIEPQ